ncbi:MAG: hypothetical protein HYS38_08870 [Acidobacteria bacterium]|nr:hypothetical protein [Acidobacteriota bacterium]
MNQPDDRNTYSSPLKRWLEAKEELQLQYYLVLFFDLLGQREQLRQLTSLPTDEEGKRKVAAVLKATVGRVVNLRVGFENYFEGMAKETDFAQNLAPPQRELLRAHTQSKLKSVGFSDSFLVFVPLATTDEHCTQMNGVHRALTAACSIMSIALSVGMPLRGGIDVGLGMELPEGEVYGPCLERAYYLESKIAGYPRVCVGEELVEYLTGFKGLRPTSNSGQVAVALAGLCSSLICKDKDGAYALDYLGAGFKQVCGPPETPQALFEKAAKFAQSEVERWSNLGEATMTGRYTLLLSYLNSRSALWKS